MEIKRSVTEKFCDAQGTEFKDAEIIVYKTNAGEFIGTFRGIKNGMLQIESWFNGDEVYSVRPKTIITCQHLDLD